MPILDYAIPSRQPWSVWRTFVWLVPVWAAGIIASHSIFGGGDDAYWWAAIGFVFALGMVCFLRRQRGLAFYCFVTVALVLAVAVLLPSFNRAT